MKQQLLVLDDGETFSGIDGSIMEWDELTEDDEDNLDNGCLPYNEPTRSVLIEQLLRESIKADLPCVKGWEL